MGIYIPNMKKPKDCYLCEFTNGYECWSNGEPWFDVKEAYAKRTLSPNCPLIDIVTCGECNRSATDDGGNTFCMWLGALRKPTDFCSYGERNGTGVKEAITQLEIIATNMVGRLAEIPNEDERQIAILNKQIEALDMGIDALKRLGE